MACHVSVAPPAGWASFGVLPIFAARNSLFLRRMDNFPGDIAVFLLFVYTRRNNRRLCCLCSTPPSCVEALSGAPRSGRWLLDVAVPPKPCPLQPLVVAVPLKHWPLRSLALHYGLGCPYRRRRLPQSLLVYTLSAGFGTTTARICELRFVFFSIFGWKPLVVFYQKPFVWYTPVFATPCVHSQFHDVL